MDLVPEPGHHELVVQVAELAAQERAPDDVQVAPPGEAADPLLGGHALESGAVALTPQVQPHQPQADAVDEAHRREAQEVQRRDERVDAVAVEDADLRRAPGQPVAQPHLFDQADGGGVGGEQVVVEALDRLAADLERAHQPAELRARLEQVDAVALLEEPVGRREAGHAAADDADGLRLAAHSGCSASAVSGSLPASPSVLPSERLIAQRKTSPAAMTGRRRKPCRAIA